MIQRAEKSFEILKEALSTTRKRKNINILGVRIDCINFNKAKKKMY